MSWIEELAAALAVTPLTPEETSVVLDAARDVAHGVERRVTPLSTFLLGAAVATSQARGTARDAAFEEAVRLLRAELDDSP